MNRKVYPYMGFFAAGILFVVMAYVMFWFLMTYFKPGIEWEGIVFHYVVFIPGCCLIPLFLLLMAYNFFVTAAPVKVTDNGFEIGWLFKKKLLWSEVTVSGLANGSEISHQNSGNTITNAVSHHYSRKVYMYFFSEKEPYMEQYINRFEIIDLLTLFHARRGVWNWPIRELALWNITETSGGMVWGGKIPNMPDLQKDYGIVLDVKRIPEKMIIMPLYDDIYAYAKKKVAEAQEAKNAEA